MSATQRERFQQWSPPGDQWPEWSWYGPLQETKARDPINIAQEKLLAQAQEGGYSPESQIFINYCTHLAKAHDTNEVEKRRTRTFDDTPYITHPYEMTAEAMRMKLDPTIIAACLIHDVPEDVKLGLLQSPEDWMRFFENEAFATYEDKERLMRILRAELKTESFAAKFPDSERRAEITNQYMNTPIGKTAVGYLKDLRDQPDLEPTAKDSEKIAEVVYDLHRLFADSYIVENGQKVFDPSMLTVKILDTWQNLKTPGFWKDQLMSEEKDAKTVAKLVRARTLANVAEFLGMREVASEMMMHLSTIHDTQNIDKPMLRQLIDEKEPQNYLQREKSLASSLEEASKIAQKIAFKGMRTDKFTPIFQSPWAVTDATKTSGEPNITLVATTKGSMTDIKLANNYDTFGLNLQATQSINSNSLRAAIYTLCGRETYHFMLSKPEGATWDTRGKSWNMLVESGAEPRIIDSCKSAEFGPGIISNSPEYGLFHPDVCKYMGPTLHNGAPSDELPDPNIMGLVNFMFSPSKFVTNSTGETDVPYAIFINELMYLATNKTDVTLHVIATNAKINNPCVSAANPWANRRLPQIVKPGIADVLDKMRNKGQIGQFNMVCVEEMQ